MNERRFVTVPLRDLCDISLAVGRMMHDLDIGDLHRPYTDIEAVHAIVEEWASDEAVLGSGCHPDHRCRLCRSFPFLADWSRRRQWAEEPAMARRYPGNELTSGLSSRLESGGTSTYTRGGVEFVLEHVSEAVVRVTHGRETGYFGLSTDPDASYPYTWTRIDHEMEAGGIGDRPLRRFATPKAALDSLCDTMLYVLGVADRLPCGEFSEDHLPDGADRRHGDER